MKLSVEISTYNRKDGLREVLSRLALQDYPHDQFEVVVADDGSDDGTPEMVESLKGTMPYTLRLVAHQNLGCGENHNSGIRAATGDILLMLADDVRAEPQLVREHLQVHEENPEPSVVVVGRLCQSPAHPQTAFHRAYDPAINSLFLKGRKDMHHGGFLVSNLSFKRNFMIECGMFHDWPAAAHEDVELGYRMRRKGMTLLSNPRALGYHHHPETIDSVTRRSYLQGYRWHYFEDSVDEGWVRFRSGHVRPSDGRNVYLRATLKHMLHRILLNRVAIEYGAVPLIKGAERFPALEVLEPFLIGKVCSYHFMRGIRAHQRDLSRKQKK